MKRSRISLWILAMSLIALPLSAESEYVYYLDNQTNYYLHITVDGKSYFFVAPNEELEIEDDDDEINVLAFYSPGQARTGEARRTLYGSDYFATGSDCDCDDGVNPVTERTWEIIPSDLD